MGNDWFVEPETVQIDLPGGDWIILKKQLNVGEERKQMASLVTEVRADGRMTPDFEMVGIAEAISYLVDWSIKDKQGKPVRIDHVADPTGKIKAAAIKNMRPEKFKLISDAVTAHIEAMRVGQEQEKNDQSGVSADAQT